MTEDGKVLKKKNCKALQHISCTTILNSNNNNLECASKYSIDQYNNELTLSRITRTNTACRGRKFIRAEIIIC